MTRLSLAAESLSGRGVYDGTPRADWASVWTV